MVIYVWPNGDWKYSWEVPGIPLETRSIDLDRWHEHDLNEQEVLACLEALEE